MTSIIKAYTPNGAAPFLPAQPDDKSFDDYLHCIRKARSGRGNEQAHRRLQNTYKSQYVIEKAPMGETSGAVGGYLVPYQYEQPIMRDVAEDSIFWPRALVVPMTSSTLQLPMPNPSTSQGISQASNIFGGMIMRWGQQNTTLTQNEPVFQLNELVANNLQCYTVASNQMVQDSPNLDGFLRKLFARAVAWGTDQCFLMGPNAPGTIDQPLGIVNAPGTLAVTRTTASTVVQADLANMYQRLLPGSIKHAIWALSPGAFNKISQLFMPGIQIVVPGDDGSAGLLFGRPFYITEKLPDVGVLGDVCLFDPTLYVIGHRGLYIDFSDQDPNVWTKNQSSWRVIWRGDGQPTLQQTVTLANQSSVKAAGYVTLSA